MWPCRLHRRDSLLVLSQRGLTWLGAERGQREVQGLRDHVCWHPSSFTALRLPGWPHAPWRGCLPALSTGIACLPGPSPGDCHLLRSPFVSRAVGLPSLFCWVQKALRIKHVKCPMPCLANSRPPAQAYGHYCFHRYSESQACLPLLDTNSTPCARLGVSLKLSLETRGPHTNPSPQKSLPLCL